MGGSKEALEEGVWGRNLEKVSLPLARPNQAASGLLQQARRSRGSFLLLPQSTRSQGHRRRPATVGNGAFRESHEIQGGSTVNLPQTAPRAWEIPEHSRQKCFGHADLARPRGWRDARSQCHTSLDAA